ncbi:hypothetical protein [Mycoplasma sp. Ms02]|uniref:hypothetical protein n=1 Tax=Mycoplasma sp. Ms02 TaxID=353851 RepID=UPI001C8AD1A9|nr:hypothetical protein [Mycoplasma sp. Ms02]QZE12494.1 hypothetical protein K4L35_00680 [Mycoplasma sp. Ms02]
MKSNSLLNTAVLIGLGIMVAALVITIIWRVWHDRKSNLASNSREIGAITKQLNTMIEQLQDDKDFRIIYNVLIPNRFAKKRYSLIPAILILQNKVFLVSNMILDNSRELQELQNNLPPKTKHLNLSWYKEIEKYLEQKHKQKIQKLILTQNDSQIQNLQDFDVVCQLELKSYCQTKDIGVWSDFEINKMIKDLSDNNQYKGR